MTSGLPDTPTVHVSPSEVRKALSNPVVQTHLVRKVKIDREHDIPYLAGYSKDGKTIYIDRHLPRTFAYQGKRVVVSKYLLIHERTEKALEEALGWRYAKAHAVATDEEHKAVRKVVPVAVYENWLKPHIKTAESERLTKVPKDLDTEPYRDSKDAGTIRRLAKAA